MNDVQVRPFRRDDRDQLTDLVNAHIAAVVPGMSVSVNTVLSQLEREPGEFIVDPWVSDRTTLVAVQRGRVVAAAHLCRYFADASVGDSYRDSGEIRWLVCAPPAPYWPDSLDAGAAVTSAAVTWLSASGAQTIHADGALPAPGVYGIPQQWPHISTLLTAAGFAAGTREEIVLLAEVAALPRTSLPGLRCVRTLGSTGTRLTAMSADEALGYIEVASLGDTGRAAQHEGWADVANLFVSQGNRRQHVGSWLIGQAAEWLRLARMDRLLDYCSPTDTDYLGFLRAVGFVELSRTSRGWTLS